MQVKVCGLVDRSNILAIDQLGVSHIGLNFYPKSPRYFLKDDPTPLHVQTRASLVGIFVNASHEEITRKSMLYNLDIIQLHGNETIEFIDQIKMITRKQIWKAISVSHPEDLNQVKTYQAVADAFVFDTKSAGYGGSGQVFDWSLLRAYKGQTPFFLAGGLSLELVPVLRKLQHPQLQGYDINSHFEEAPGLKSVDLVSSFLSQINRIHE